MVAALLAAGADPSIKSRIGNTALHLAALNGRVDCVRQLLAATPPTRDAKTNLGATPLHMACQVMYVWQPNLYLRLSVTQRCIWRR